ncbi:PilZ domain-containing protein [Novosphingobium malaysiense]|uniref:PilZ domain-containing protein n=1 Tax=Novosphingobium malaysiense TaxID=1348853 RepID=A0A0B1ZWP3_9SPHN|nr:PilZ domain-containing protein [Novosphingobium malaysiense]KHK93577.1 hypothetical protein LK12_04880 [Novosphingobium malaysiense]
MDERKYERVVADREIECIAAGLRSKVVLYDLSAGGCMIETRQLVLANGASVYLVLNHFLETSGQIAWQAEGHAGVQFGQMLNEAAVRFLGFSPSRQCFETMIPRDRFGRLLPPLQ